MLKRTKLAKSLLIAFSGSAVLAGMPALAQQTQPQPQQLQRVEVTGSNIRRVESETASPVQVLSREEIDRSGKASVAELLQTLSVDNQGSVPTTFGNGFASGASGISLRGLGTAATLVLVNGRRVAPYGLADDGQKVFADLNMIPLEAVDRVEILKDGGSAIYGSDAIAGVVNIILRKDFKGVVLKATYGDSQKGGGAEKRGAITAGFGDLDKDRYNILFNLEVGRKGEIYNRDRAGREQIGRTDLRDLGFSAQEALGGTGAITGNNAAGSAINGNVRQPGTNDYYNRGNGANPNAAFTQAQPGAACGNFTNHQQGDPGYTLANGGQSGQGCLIDAAQLYGQIQPSQESVNFFTRGTLQLTSELTGYAEVNLYNNKSVSYTTPTGISGSVGYPGGPVANNDIRLGAAHPDNPYFGSSARLRYLAADVGPRVSNIDSTFTRVVAGVKGTVKEWDIDSALLFSQNKVKNERTGYLQRDVMFALLNPTGFLLQPGATVVSPINNAAVAAKNSAAYAALPAGTLWRIGENAGLNSAAMYAALSPTISNDAKSETTQIDFKASREIATLPGGGLGLALGAEARRESVRLDPTSGTDRGNIVGLGYSAYDGTRNLVAAYAELNAPVLQSLELSGAVRVDHYSDVGNSVTPKLGAKWTPVNSFAVRGTYAQGFRAPGAAENGKGGLAAFSTASDPLRCALGVQTACAAANVAIITSPNPALEPEKSRSYTLGFVWDPTPKTSFAVDFFKIIRKNEINQEQITEAIAKGQVARDPGGATAIPGDPGPIVAVLANYVNSSKSTVQGVDLDARQSFDLGTGYGKLLLDAKWTHLFKLEREETDGTKRDFAGTHGNCDVTNCIGTPADRVNLGATWDFGDFKLSGVLNYRASLDNRDYKDAPDCAFHYADGTDSPSGCKIRSFTTVDLNFRWKATKQIEVFGGVQNVFDRVAPLDPYTYGATSYNPLDYSGAVGRYFNVGLKYRFN
jgi:iron complex outermembrane recepter protein